MGSYGATIVNIIAKAVIDESAEQMAKRLFEDGWRISRPENEEE